MKPLSRGRFLGLAAGTAGAGLVGACGGTNGSGSGSRGVGPHADLIVHGRRIHTMDDANPAAESLAVREGRFPAVGSRDEVEALRGPETRVFDHGDAVITPGFIDAHTTRPARGSASSRT